MGVLEQASSNLFILISELSDRRNQLAYVISKLNENMEKENLFDRVELAPKKFYFNIIDKFFNEVEALKNAVSENLNSNSKIHELYKEKLISLGKSLDKLNDLISSEERKAVEVLKALEELRNLQLSYEATSSYYLGLQNYTSKSVDAGVDALRTNTLFSNDTCIS